MKFIYCASCIAILLMLTGIVGASEVATVHGIAYEWSTFEPLDNAIIEVNSTPAQSIVAKYGEYSFELPNGSYLITAKYYQDNELTHYGDEVVTVTGQGNYVLDLLLLPSYSDSETINTGSVSDIIDAEENNSASGGNNLLAVTFLIVILLLGVLVYQFHQKSGGPRNGSKLIRKEVPDAISEPAMNRPSAPVAATTSQDTSPVSEVSINQDTEDVVNDVDTTVTGSKEDMVTEIKVSEVPETKEVEVPAPKEEKVPSGPVPADLQEILDILKSQGGRMTQKDMRKRLKYSEGKVSLMLLDLEKRGKIQKFKKGRGNVLFLVDEVED